MSKAAPKAAPQPLKDGYYRLTSERASSKSIAQHIRNEWFLIGEVEAVTTKELNRRGWTVDSRVNGMSI